jgi:agmatinase
MSNGSSSFTIVLNTKNNRTKVFTYFCPPYGKNPARMTKEDAIENFDPNGVAAPGRLFGLPFDVDNASLVLIPVPWEVTVSYSAGCAKGPEAILKASSQVDLYQKDIEGAWKYGIAMLDLPRSLRKMSEALRVAAANYIEDLEEGFVSEDSAEAKEILAHIDAGCKEMVDWVRQTAVQLRAKGKRVALVGGDHSTPLGLIEALASDEGEFGILQLDAHADLRVAYEGFEYSHASIMYNALKLAQVSKLVQVGIRDFCESEAEMIRDAKGRIETFFYPDLEARRFGGESWEQICNEIISRLPQKVYLSFDIDALDPKLCPNTGTPVPGGFEFEEVNYLMTMLARSGKVIIGFDLNEVSPGPAPDALDHNDWDGNVGARLLYRMCNLMGVSQGNLMWADRR